MTGRMALAIALVWLALPRDAPAAPPGAAADVLVEAGAALGAGEHERAAALSARIARDPRPIDRQDRAEAWRILGLAQHALGRRGEAEASFYAYLKLNPDAHLDPAVVPPDAVSFFEEVRAKHQAELNALRPKPKRRRTLWLNFVPLGGQWQNGDTRKMWILGSAGLVLLGANITSYAVLRSWCGSPGGRNTCDEGTPGMPGYVDHAPAARRLQIVNIASGVGLVALYTAGVIDGIQGYRRWKEESQQQPVLGLTADSDSVFLSVSGRF